MAIRLSVIKQFKETIKLNRPTEELGVTSEESFGVVYRHVKETEFADLMERMKSGDLTNKGLLELVVEGYVDLGSVGGQPITSDQFKAYMMEELDIINAVTTRFVEALHGTKQKNSAGSRKR